MVTKPTFPLESRLFVSKLTFSPHAHHQHQRTEVLFADAMVPANESLTT